MDLPPRVAREILHKKFSREGIDVDIVLNNPEALKNDERPKSKEILNAFAEKLLNEKEGKDATKFKQGIENKFRNFLPPNFAKPDALQSVKYPTCEWLGNVLLAFADRIPAVEIIESISSSSNEEEEPECIFLQSNSELLISHNIKKKENTFTRCANTVSTTMNITYDDLIDILEGMLIDLARSREIAYSKIKFRLGPSKKPILNITFLDKGRECKGEDFQSVNEALREKVPINVKYYGTLERVLENVTMTLGWNTDDIVIHEAEEKGNSMSPEDVVSILAKTSSGRRLLKGFPFQSNPQTDVADGNSPSQSSIGDARSERRSLSLSRSKRRSRSNKRGRSEESTSKQSAKQSERSSGSRDRLHNDTDREKMIKDLANRIAKYAPKIFQRTVELIDKNPVDEQQIIGNIKITLNEKEKSFFMINAIRKHKEIFHEFYRAQ